VALDEAGRVLRAKELTGIGTKDPKRMVTLIDEIMDHLQPDDVICIESPAMHAQGSAVGFMWGLAHGLRMAMFRRGWHYIDVAPAGVKKFASGKGNTKKDELAVHIYKRWDFEHPSDNVRDAYVLAQIARALSPDIEVQLTKQQAEVLQAIRKAVAAG
jgi:crossover junction endodeoxyribonuclease RuvC